MNPRILLAVTVRVLTQLRRDRRTVAMLLVLPCVLITLLWWMFKDQPGDLFNRFGPGLLAIFPFIVMFLVTSVTTLRERSSGTLERLLAMPMGKLDFLGGYALAFGLVATAQAALAVALSVGLLGLDISGPVWLLGLVAVADAVLGTALGLFVPRDALPEVLHRISDLLPLSYATDAMQSLVTSSATADVWRNLGIVTAFAVAALALGAATLRRRTP